ncbi:hypothetical protein Ancab_018270 [Ancistrocladus abbreviatus]
MDADQNHRSTAGNDIDMLQMAVKQISQSEDIAGENSVANDADNHQLLVRLLSELESLKADGTIKKLESSAELNEVHSCAVSEAETNGHTAGAIAGSAMGTGVEELVKEIKKVKRQNTVTHWLLSTLIVLTVAWQLSEVSLMLKLKNGLSHPFRSLGSMLTGILKGPITNGQDQEKQNEIEGPALPPVKAPELSRMDLKLPS